jgi:ABC-type branched-subunit amino acid transport system substrate-binding protein
MHFGKSTIFKVGVAALMTTMVIGSAISASATTHKVVHKSTILIGTISDGNATVPPATGLPDSVGGIHAALMAINKAGGIHGHMLKLVSCDSAGNPNTSAACGRLMVTDKVAAVVGDESGGGATYIPVLQAANIPVLGDYAITSADLTCTICFPMISSVSVIAGEANLLASLGYNKISIPVVGTPAAAGLSSLASLGLAPYNLTLLNTPSVPPNAPDMSSYVAAVMAGGTDAVMLGLVGSDGARFVQTARSLGYTNITYASDCSNMGVAISAGFASSLQGVWGVCLFLPPTDTSSAAVKTFDANMKLYSPKTAKVDITENAYVATYLFRQVALTLKSVTGPNVLAAMPSVTFKNALLPTVSFAKVQSPIPGFQLFNNQVLLVKVENGKFVPVNGKFTNPFIKNAQP